MPALRVGFDAVRALRNTTGLGNYSRRTLAALRAADADLDLHLYSSRAPAAAFAGFPDSIGATLHLPPAPARFGPGPALWRTFRIGHRAARDGVQLYHGLTHEIPRDLPGTRIPSVVTVHDLIFERHPGWFHRADRISYRWRYRWSARHAGAVIAVSTRTRDDLIALYHIDPARIAVIPPPRDERFAIEVPAATRAEVRSRYRLPNEYLLTVGTLEPRKNQCVLVNALALDRARRLPPLVLAGRDGGSAAALLLAAQAAGVGDRIHLLANVTDADLPALVQGAAAFAYPSLDEGFGMPVTEALSAGVPVIAAAGGHLVDAGGPAARYVPPSEAEGWRTTIDAVLHDSAAQETMRATGRVHANRFRGDRLAARVRAVYDAVLAGGPVPPDDLPSGDIVETAR